MLKCKISIKLFVPNCVFMCCMYGDTIYTEYPSKNTSPKMATTGGRNTCGHAVYTTINSHIVYAHVGLVSHNESSVDGHESFKTAFKVVCNYKVYPIFHINYK